MERGKPTVVHVTPWYLPHLGGLERHVETISMGIRSFNFVILTPRIPGTSSFEEPAENVRIVRFGPPKYAPTAARKAAQSPRDWVSRIAGMANLNRLLSRTSFDVLHVHRPPLMELAYLTGKWRNIGTLKALTTRVNRLRVGRNPRVFTDHGLFVLQSTVSRLDLRWFMEFVLEEFEHVISVDRGGFEQATRIRDSDPKRYSRVHLHHVPQAIDTDMFRLAPLPDTRDLIVGYSGRWERDGMFLLQSLVEADLSGVRWRVSGGATERDHEQYTRVLKRPNVVLQPNLQSLEELSRFYQGIHVLVDFYRGDGCGRSVLEAMSCGRPVVRIRAHDTHPVSDSETGVLVDPVVSDISRALRELKERRDWLAQMGLRAREAIEREYRLQDVLLKIERIYRDCLDSSST